jgi:hypothetical protein
MEDDVHCRDDGRFPVLGKDLNVEIPLLHSTFETVDLVMRFRGAETDVIRLDPDYWS